MKQRLPLLPLKDLVIFPRMVAPLLVGRPGSIAAVEESITLGCPLFVCTQIDPAVESPDAKGVHQVGVAVNILQTVRMPDASVKVVIEGLYRASVRRITNRAGFLEAFVQPIESKPLRDKKSVALMRTTLNQFEEYVRLSQRIAPEIVQSLRNVSDPETLIDFICAFFPVRGDERQAFLSMVETRERLEKLSGALMRENELLEIEKKVRERVREQMERTQREYYLHEQLKAIHQELGNGEDGADDFAELKESITKAGMPKDVEEKALRELSRYQRMQPMSPEGAVIRTYIEWLVEAPWKKRTHDSIDITVAKKVLDEDHYGLEKVKERIIEFLAVRKLSKSTKGPILCLVGPPGVGKTSLGQSIARAMKRKFVRMSLGGVRDEAEIRGHRRTYVGSLPGRIIQNMKKAGVKNPVFMLDEVDKMNMDFRGDPASALLEVLDPEQNHAFNDHYLEVDFDLREVFFITTANDEYAIPHALHDRMEVVRIPGYTTHEKLRIARLFLIPKQIKECGLTEKDIRFEDSGVNILIERYTREAGVRELERQISNVCRKIARKVVEAKPKKPIVIDEKKPSDLLGPYEYSEIRAELEPQVGVGMGMAWTMAGGDTLCIETSVMKGKGGLMLTGQLGDVMKESAQAAYTYIRARAAELKAPATFFKTMDLHVHVPEGAIPKDGPSAGVTIAVSMLSALRNVAPKKALAMTGEITLRGRVLPVGGIKEKVLAAHRAGIRTIVLPQENDKDLVEIPKDVRDEVNFVLVKDVAEVFAMLFD
jgi:ATP-dependent Lon protease